MLHYNNARTARLLEVLKGAQQDWRVCSPRSPGQDRGQYCYQQYVSGPAGEIGRIVCPDQVSPSNAARTARLL